MEKRSFGTWLFGVLFMLMFKGWWKVVRRYATITIKPVASLSVQLRLKSLTSAFRMDIPSITSKMLFLKALWRGGQPLRSIYLDFFKAGFHPSSNNFWQLFAIANGISDASKRLESRRGPLLLWGNFLTIFGRFWSVRLYCKFLYSFNTFIQQLRAN